MKAMRRVLLQPCSNPTFGPKLFTSLEQPNQEHLTIIVREICTVVSGRNNNKHGGSTAGTGAELLL